MSTLDMHYKDVKGVPEAKNKIYQMGIWIYMKNDDHPKW